MRNSNVSLGAGIAGAVLLAVPVLHMILGASAPGVVDAIVGLFGFILLAVSVSAGATWPDGSPRPRPHRRVKGKVAGRTRPLGGGYA